MMECRECGLRVDGLATIAAITNTTESKTSMDGEMYGRSHATA